MTAVAVKPRRYETPPFPALSQWAQVSTGPFRFDRATQQSTGPRDANGMAVTPLSFRAFVAAAAPRFVWYDHCVRLAAVLQSVADGERKRVIIAAPPRHGKSELLSRLFTAYYLYRHPHHWVGLASYGAELAYSLSRNARDNFVRGGGRLKYDAAAVKHWETAEGGGMWAAGVGGPATGKGGHLLVVDDPVKDAREAASEVIGRRNREWYQAVLSTRAEPDAALIVQQTRWPGPGDLVGFLYSQEEEDDTPERWHVVSFEAIKEETPAPIPATCTLEPDPRAVGEALCPGRYPLARLQQLAKRLGTFFFGALFQQRPRPKEGHLFKWDWFVIVDAVPAVGRRVRYWDTAGTDKHDGNDPDFTVGVLMVLSPDGVFTVEDVAKGQWSPARRDVQIKTTAEADAAKYGRTGVHQWFEQEAGIGGTERTQAVIRMLAGMRVTAERVTGSKEDRATPLMSQAEAGNVRLLRAPWNNDFRNVLCDFPFGGHDDDVDAASGALNKLAGGPATATNVPFRIF